MDVEQQVFDYVTSSGDISDFSSRILSMAVFLIVFSLAGYFFLMLIKKKKGSPATGGPQSWLQNSFIGKMLGMKAQSDSSLYNMSLIQRQPIADGSELFVVDVNGRHLLLGKALNGNLNYITDLNRNAQTTLKPELNDIENKTVIDVLSKTSEARSPEFKSPIQELDS